MAYSKLYACDSCAAGEVLLTFAEAWGAASPESAPDTYPGYGGVAGLFSVLWCEECRTTRPLILLRLDLPGSHPVIAYAEAQRQNRTGAETGTCLIYGQTLTTNPQNRPCSECEAGKWQLVGEWEAQ